MVCPQRSDVSGVPLESVCPPQVLTYAPLYFNGFESIPRCKLWFTLAQGHTQLGLLELS